MTHRYWPFVGGSERYVAEIAQRWAAEGGASAVYTTDAWDLAHLWERGRRRIPVKHELHRGVNVSRFAVQHPSLSRWLFSGRRWLASRLPAGGWCTARRLSVGAPRVPELQHALQQNPLPADLVHGWNITLDGLLWPALAAAHRAGAPFLVTPFTHLGGRGNRYTAPHQVRLLQAASHVIAMTEIEADALVELGVEPRRVTVASPGVTPDELMGGDGEAFRAAHEISGPLVAFIGALAREKGAQASIAAIGRLVEKGRDVTLALAGPTTDDFQRYVALQPAAVRAACRLLGYVNEDEKRALLAAADLVVMPSRTESFGIVFLEAWVHGLPVIGARAGGVPAVIEDGVDGFLVPFGDVATLAQRIATLLDDHTLAEDMGQAGRAKALQRYSWDQTWQTVREVYSRVL